MTRNLEHCLWDLQLATGATWSWRSCPGACVGAVLSSDHFQGHGCFCMTLQRTHQCIRPTIFLAQCGARYRNTVNLMLHAKSCWNYCITLSHCSGILPLVLKSPETPYSISSKLEMMAFSLISVSETFILASFSWSIHSHFKHENFSWRLLYIYAVWNYAFYTLEISLQLAFNSRSVLSEMLGRRVGPIPYVRARPILRKSNVRIHDFVQVNT